MWGNWTQSLESEKEFVLKGYMWGSINTKYFKETVMLTTEGCW